MTFFCRTLSLIVALWALVAVAGPRDVLMAPAEPSEGVLQPHHQLAIPEPKPADAPLPPPPPQATVNIAQGEISISEGDSVLAYQGTLIPFQHQFSEEVWQYMSAEEATQMIARLPKTMPLPLLRDRIVTLLQLKAPPPRGAGDGWLSIRLAALQRLGASEAAAKLLREIPTSLRDSMKPQLLFDFFLNAQQPQLACEAIEGQEMALEDEEVWPRIMGVCAALLGDFSKAELHIALAEESGQALPSWYMTLIDHLQYGNIALPEAGEASSPREKQLITALQEQQTTRENVKKEKSFPKNPAYAVLAIAQHIRDGTLEKTDEWLSMLDRSSGDSASSYVAHELVRFLRRDLDVPMSLAARTLPPFGGVEGASKADIALLKRFYAVMLLFDYDLPNVTLAWLDAQSVPKSGKSAAMKELRKMASAGNKAGFLLAMPEWLKARPVSGLSTLSVLSLVELLQQIQEPQLARRIAAEAILVKME